MVAPARAAIWRWAGDTATDVNHYTKRALLAGILAELDVADARAADKSQLLWKRAVWTGVVSVWPSM